ncbi:TonB-dependent receptor domain-containing protein [Psychromonas sp. KJ10-10]|uniref:TonB-dependent receptor domain-containing protein n=1 Tax=Psychromonas sp. KJ10-10 TaxID=3391823 RepID=UPI0039B44DCE
MDIKKNRWIKPSLVSLAVTSALMSQSLMVATESNSIETLTVTGEQSSAVDINIDKSHLEKSQAGDLKDIFKNEAEVSVGGATSVSQKVYVRGLESNMLNVTIDGAKQSSSTFHHQGSISIEPELLKQVDVQAGTGNALSGAGALGGEVKFITKDPLDLLEAGDRFGALVKGGYSTNAEAYKASLSVYGSLTDNWSAMATVVQTEANNYDDGDGNEIEYSAYDQQNGLIKLVGNFDNNQRFSISYDNRIDDGERLVKPNWTPGVKNTGVEMEAHRKTGTIEYSIDPTDNQWLALETSAYYTENNILRVSDNAEGMIESYGFDIRNSNKFSKYSITYGADYRNDKSSYQSTSESSRLDEGDVYGLYLQAEVELAQSWLLNIGSRYDIYQTTDADGLEFDSKGFSPNVSLLFTPLSNLQLELGYAQAMRGVEVRESYLIYDGGYTNSEDLDAETAENIEFSVDYQLNQLAMSAKIYHSTVDDVIDYGEWGDVDYKEFNNDGELVNKGVTLGLNYHWPTVQAGITYNHNTAQLNGEILGDYYDTDLGTSTGDIINTNVSYQLSQSVELGWSANFVTRLTEVANDFYEKPGYGVHDIYGQWLPLKDDALKVTFSVSNLFDKHYRDQSTFGESIYGDAGDMSPGRDFRINLAWAL